MRVSQRLLLTLTPAFVGLLTVVGLAYWGQYQRQAPHFAVIAAAIGLGASVVLALRNARYLAQRIERLAGTESDRAVDELDSIEQSVERLQTEVATARDEVVKERRAASHERKETATLMSTATRAATSALDEIRLPLHILLENRFGDLNENQEEMLGSAQAAAEGASVLFQRLQLSADLDRGAVELRRDPVRVDDVVRGQLPVLQSHGERRNVRVNADIAPALPRVLGDRTLLIETLSILLRGAIERTPGGGEVSVRLEGADGRVRLTATHGGGEVRPLDEVLVRQLTNAMGIRFIEDDRAIIIEISSV